MLWCFAFVVENRFFLQILKFWCLPYSFADTCLFNFAKFYTSHSYWIFPQPKKKKHFYRSYTVLVMTRVHSIWGCSCLPPQFSPDNAVPHMAFCVTFNHWKFQSGILDIIIILASRSRPMLRDMVWTSHSQTVSFSHSNNQFAVISYLFVNVSFFITSFVIYSHKNPWFHYHVCSS